MNEGKRPMSEKGRNSINYQSLLIKCTNRNMVTTMRKEWAFVLEIGKLISISHLIYSEISITTKAS